jgi:PGF-pre-PGF domain-containing protein
MDYSVSFPFLTISHASKLILLIAFALTVLSATSMAAISTSTDMMIVDSSNNAVNSTYYNYSVSFNVTQTGGPDNITNINITAPENITFAADNVSVDSGWICTNNETLVNCTNSSLDMSSAIVTVSLWSNSTGTYFFGMNFSDNASELNSSSLVLYVDTTRPLFTVAINGTQNFNITSGETVYVEVIATSDVAPLIGVNVSIVTADSVFECAANESIDSQEVSYLTYNANCTFANTTRGGWYAIMVETHDKAGWVNFTDINWNTTGFFTVWNGMPMYGLNDSELLIQDEAFARERPSYEIIAPLLPLFTEGFNGNASNVLMPAYFFDTLSLISASRVETPAYNYTFNLNSSVNGTVAFNLTLFGTCPIREGQIAIQTLAGMRNITSFMALCGDSPSSYFTIYWNGSALDSQGPINVNHPVNGTYNYNNDSTIILTANASSETLMPITVLFSPMSIAIASEVATTGFNSSNPPTPGSSANLSIFLNLTAYNPFFTADNTTVSYIFPRNMTYTQSNGTNVTHVVSTYVLLSMWNETNGVWELIANSSAIAADFPNRSIVTPVDESIMVNDTIPGSPTFGDNITIAFWGFRYRLDQNTTLGWKRGDIVVLNSSAGINLPYFNVTSGNGAAGTSVSYNATVSFGLWGGLTIPDSQLPGFSPSATITKLNVNGESMLGTNAYNTTGGIHFYPGVLIQGPNVIMLQYSVPSPSSQQGPNGGGSGTGNGTNTTSQSILIATVFANVPIVAVFDSSLLDIRQLNLTVNSTAYNVKLIISTLGSKPAEISANPLGTLYKYLNITTQNLADQSITDARIKFRVNKSWYSTSNLNVSTTVLNRYSNNKWTSLKTMLLSNDSNYYYFEAQSPGFSIFAVTASPNAAPAPSTCPSSCQTGQSQRAYPDCSCYTPSSGGTTETVAGMDWTIVTAGVIVVLAVIAGLKVFKKKKHRYPISN